ncbi:unnamed protein product, partial [Prorocentrum cordatum]
CDGLLQQARLLGDTELEAKLTEVAAQLAHAQQELQAKAAQAQHPPPAAPAGTAPSGARASLRDAASQQRGQRVQGSMRRLVQVLWVVLTMMCVPQKLLEACASAVGDDDDMDLDEGAKRAVKQRAIELFGQALKKMRSTYYVPPQLG